MDNVRRIALTEGNTLDNLTHTLIGVLLGETAARIAAPPKQGLRPEQRRSLLITEMVIGGNLPDLDFVYPVITGNKLDYLLQHRGHTHTLVGVVIIALCVLAGSELWMRMRRWRPSRNDRWWLATLALFAPLLHLAMDFSNSYGVHPFWPLDNRWFYGDAVFIVEPLFWAAVAPLVFLLRTRVARSLIFIVLAGGIGLSIATALVPLALIALYCGLAAVLLIVGRYARPAIALTTSIAVWLFVTLLFAAASHVAGTRATAYAASNFSSETTLDRVLAPMPMNPLCWELILVQSRGEHYSLRRAMLSLAPSVAPADKCRSRSMSATTTAPLEPVNALNTSELQWYGEFSGSRESLITLSRTSCAAAALLRFARAPWMAESEKHFLLGDLRYDREPELGFAEIEADKEKCPTHVPPWTSPRSDLLR